MTFIEQLEQAASNLIAWIVTGTAGGFLWLVRRVITNQKQIEMLQSEIRHRDELRSADRATVQEVRDDVKELRREFRALFHRE